jgi:anti-sigma factor RsiW
MARSLTVKHTEEPGTSSLLNAFLLLAFGWMMAGMLIGGLSSDAQATTPTTSQIDAP